MRFRLALAVCLVLVVPSLAAAQEDFAGARAMAKGEAVRATASGAEAVFFNPAAMSMRKQYVIEGTYGIKIEDVGHHLNVAIVDSVTTRVAAGLFYSFIYTNPKAVVDWAGGRLPSPDINRQGHVAGLSLSLNLGERFMLGVTAKYLHFDTTVTLPKGSVPGSLTLDSINGITFDVGLLARLGNKFNIGVIGYNLWDHGSRETKLSLGMGLGLIPIPSLTINFDTVIIFSGRQTALNAMGKSSGEITARLGPGIEYLISGKVPIRAGLIWDSWMNDIFLTLGSGYTAEKFAIDLGYRAKLNAGLENTLMLGIRIFVN